MLDKNETAASIKWPLDFPSFGLNKFVGATVLIKCTCTSYRSHYILLWKVFHMALCTQNASQHCFHPSPRCFEGDCCWCMQRVPGSSLGRGEEREGSNAVTFPANAPNVIVLRPSPRPYPGLNQGHNAHINNWHPQSIVTYRSTKATALAAQGKQLLQGLRVSDTSPIERILACTS